MTTCTSLQELGTERGHTTDSKSTTANAIISSLTDADAGSMSLSAAERYPSTIAIRELLFVTPFLYNNSNR